MSMRGSPINWWKEKRQSSHSGIPHANRPQTAFPWNAEQELDLSKVVEQAVLSAFESTAFKIAVASQVDPAFTRHQEKLNQIKTTNLNLESVLQGHVEDFPILLKGVEDHVTETGMRIRDYGEQFEGVTAGQERLEKRIDEMRKSIPDYSEEFTGIFSKQERLEKRIDEMRASIPDYSDEFSEIISSQGKFVKLFESRMSAIEARLEDMDRKTSDLDEGVVNADLRSAIRFGEISNELQDRNTTLNNSIWEVQRELGKKVDALQRRVVGACEDVGKVVRGSKEVVEGMRAKMEEDDVLAAVGKVSSRAEFSEKAIRRSMVAIQDKVSLLDTSALLVQSARLEGIERGMGEFKKEAEAARNLASVSSKFLSANTSKLDSMASAVGKMHLLVEHTSEVVQEVAEAQEANAGTFREDVEAVRLHVRSLDNLAVSHARKLSDATTVLTRMEGADAVVMGRLGELKDNVEGVEERLRPLSSHGLKLDGLESSLSGMIRESKPQRGMLDDLTTTIAEMRSNVDSALSSHTDFLSTIHKTVSNSHSKDALSTALLDLQSSIEKKISSSHESTSQSTIEAITTHVSNLDSQLQIGFRSLKDDTESQTYALLSPLAEIMSEMRFNKSLLETENATARESFKTTRDAIEATQLAVNSNNTVVKSMIQDLHEASKDEEILLQIESWAQNCIAKQAAEVASMRDLLDLSQTRDENLQQSVDGLGEKHVEMLEFLKSGELESSSTIRELESLKGMLSHEEGLGGLSGLAKTTLQTLSSVHASIRDVQADDTLNAVKDLAVQNAASIATANAGILGLDSQLKSSEESVLSTVRDVQTSIGKDILEAKNNITTATHDDVTKFSSDLTTRISTSTDVLRSEIQNVDLSSTLTAIEELKSQLDQSAVKNEECTRSVGEDVKSTLQGKIDGLIGDVKDLGDVLGKGQQANDSAFSELRDLSTTNATTLSTDFARLHESLTPISQIVEGVASITLFVEGVDQGVKATTTTLSSIDESLATNANKIDSQLESMKDVIDSTSAKTLDAVQANHILLNEIQQSSSKSFATSQSSIQSVNAAVTESGIEISSANAALTALSAVCEDIPRIREVVESVHVATLEKIDGAAGMVEKVVLASAAGLGAEMLSVRSEIGGLVAASVRAETLAEEAGQVQGEVLSVVKSNAAGLEGVQEVVRRVEGQNKEAFSGLKTEIADIGAEVTKGNVEVREDVQTVISGVKDINTSISQSAKENELAHVATIAALSSEAKGIRDVLVSEAEKTNSTVSANVETARKSIIAEVECSKTVLGEKVAEVTSKVGDITTAVSQASTENNLAHAATLAAFALESKSIRDVVVGEAEKTSTSFSADLEMARKSIVGDVERSRIVLGERVDVVVCGVRDVTTAVARVEAESTRLHGVTLGAVRSESKTVLDAVTAAAEKTNESFVSGLLGTKDEIAKDIASVQSAIKESRDVLGVLSTDTNRKLDEASMEASKAHEATLAAMASESNSTREAVTASAEKTTESLNSKIDAFQGNLTSELSSTQDILSKDIANIQSSIKESSNNLTELSTTLTQKLDTSLLESSKNHTETLAALSTESKSLTAALTTESEKMHSTIAANLETVKAAVVSEIDRSSALTFADLAVLKTSGQKTHEVLGDLSTSVMESTKKLDDVAAGAGRAHLEVVALVEEQKRVVCDVLAKEVGSLNEAVEMARSKLEERVGGVEVVVLSGLEGVKKDLSNELESVGKNVLGSREGLKMDLEAGFLKAETNHDVVLNVVREESKSLSGVVVGEVGKMEVAVGAAKDATVLEVQQSRSLVEEKIGSAEETISVKFGETNGNITKEFNGIGLKADERHEITLEALKSASLETTSAMEKITTKNIEALSTEIQQSKTLIDEKLDSVEKAISVKLSETNETITKGFDNVTTTASQRHEITLEALKSASSETVSTIEQISTKSMNTLSKEIGAGLIKAGSNHDTTIEALKTSSATISEVIIREIGNSATITTSGVQSLLTEISKTYQSLTTLQTTTTTLSTETATNFSHAATARKKAQRSYEGHVDSILEAIRQQGKTTSSCVDAVQKVVLTGVQNMNSSLEGFVSQESATTRKTIEDLTSLLDSNTATLHTRLDTGFETVSEERREASMKLDGYVNTLSAAIKDEAETTQARVETLHSRVLDEVQKTDSALRSSVSSLKTNIETSSKTHSENHDAMQAEIKTLTPSLKAIDAAVRVNSAAIARVDKAVLESASQVKAEMRSSIQSLNGQLDDELQEMGRRVRGIAEYEIPRLEALARRQRDAVEVIGGRIVGTTKRFDEMVANFGKGPGGSGAMTGGLEKSELLGMSGRLRGGSNASSTRSKDSGYRMGAFESGGRM
ncbi:hypothetical protein IFR05_012458 [Cadophora sp. M221]|nr:hypothetical protein IFR05_012458 [Cadophora sp. M221]